jgi:hypothetical protein
MCRSSPASVGSRPSSGKGSAGIGPPIAAESRAPSSSSSARANAAHRFCRQILALAARGGPRKRGAATSATGWHAWRSSLYEWTSSGGPIPRARLPDRARNLARAFCEGQELSAGFLAHSYAPDLSSKKLELQRILSVLKGTGIAGRGPWPCRAPRAFFAGAVSRLPTRTVGPETRRPSKPPSPARRSRSRYGSDRRVRRASGRQRADSDLPLPRSRPGPCGDPTLQGGHPPAPSRCRFKAAVIGW